VIIHQWQPAFWQLLHFGLMPGETVVEASECFTIRIDTRTRQLPNLGTDRGRSIDVLVQPPQRSELTEGPRPFVVNVPVGPPPKYETNQYTQLEQWKGIALTNLNLRVFFWATEKPRGLVSVVKQMATMPIMSPPAPQIVSQLTFPLLRIQAHELSTIRNNFWALKHVLKVDAGDLAVLRLSCDSRTYEFVSPYTDFHGLAVKLDAAITGQQLGLQTAIAADSISKLAALRAEGILTDEEFDRAKAGLLGADVRMVETAASQLRQLYSLFKSGVLTDSEFRMKKWDILSRS